MSLKRLASPALWVVLILTGALVFTSRIVTPKDPAMENVLTEAKDGGYQLIHAKELWERYQKEPENTLLVDTRQDWEYRTGHIKGALHFSMEPTWWSRWRKKGAMKRFLGPDKNRFIAFY